MMSVRVKPEYILWWLAALLLFLATDVWWFEHSAHLVSPAHQTQLAAFRAWSPPLASFLASRDLGVWPFWSFAMAASVLCARLIGQKVAPQASLAAVALLAGLAGTLQPAQLVCGYLVVAAGSLVPKLPDFTARKSVLIASTLITASVFTTLEFGLVILILAAPIMGRLIARFRSEIPEKRGGIFLLAAAILAMAAVAPGLVHEGYLAAMLRPVSWLWRDTRLIPSIKLLHGSDVHQAGQLLAAMAIVIACYRILASTTTYASCRATAVALTFIGLGCGAYTSLTALALWAMTPSSQVAAVRPPKRWLAALCVVTALLPWALLISRYGVNAMGGGSQRPVVGSDQWKFEGSVLLTDLDHAEHWSNAEDRKRFPLLLDNRWDVDSNQRDEYVSAVNDLLNGLREFYLKEDGSSGGYALFTRRQQPTLIEIDSTRLSTIRRMSVDPQWRVLAIDSRRTIFGRSDSSLTGPQTEKMSRLCMRLEWPRAGGTPDTDGMLALGMPGDSRKVAQVLRAMRLPYAALRVLPNDDLPQTRLIRAWCYLELAHRCMRHTGRDSLLDRYRAVAGFRLKNVAAWSSHEDREKIERALQSLDSKEIRAVSITDSDNERSHQETAVRSALRAGDSESAKRAIGLLPNAAARDLFEAIRRAAVASPSKVRKNIDDVISQEKLPPHLREESLFYAACLDLELGNVEAANANFVASQKLNPTSSLSALRAIHVGKLGGKN